MSVKVEIAELMNKKGLMYEWAEKVEYNLNLSSEEKEISEVVDVWAKEIGKTGNDKDREIANFIIKTLTPEVYEAPEQLLDTMFDRGSIGEFDDFRENVAPENTLVAYDAARGGNVPKSFIDVNAIAPVWKNKQIETEVSFADLRRGGYKTIANLTTYGKEALQNAMISDIFTSLDTAITGDEASITETGSLPTVTSMDQLALYLIDRVDNGTPFCFGLNKYAQAIAKLAGYTTYMTDKERDVFNRFGLAKQYGGINIAGISGAKKTGDGALLVPDKKIFGVAGKIGTLNMRGDIHVYENSDINRERIHIKIADFAYGYSIRDIDKVCKITMA